MVDPKYRLLPEFQKRLKALKKQKKHTNQKEIASKAHIGSRTTVSQFFNGKGVTYANAANILELYGLTVEEACECESSIEGNQNSELYPVKEEHGSDSILLPHSTVADFVGRDKQLTELNDLLQRENAIPIVITGMPGIGKSELSLQYAWQYRQQYCGGIAWIDARNEDIASRLIQFAANCNIRPPDGLDVFAQLRYCCQQWSQLQKLILFVLDDLDEYKQVSALFPVLPSCVRILITTRRYFGSSLPIEQIMLGALDSDAALELLGSVMDANQPKRIDEERSAALELCAFLEYLPLALELIGRYLDLDPDMSIQSLYKRIRNNTLQSSVLTGVNPVMRVQRGVGEAFNLSWELLPEDAKRLGCFLALFSPSSISWFLVEEASETLPPSLVPVEARPHLLSLYLLRKTGKGKYLMHRLLQEFFQIKLDQLGCGEPLKRGLMTLLAVHASRMPEHPNREQIVLFQELASHIRETVPALLAYAADNDFYPLFVGVCHFYQGQGRYHQALEWSKQYLGIAQDRLGSFNSSIMKMHRELGCLYYFMNNFQEAEDSFQNALTILQQLEEDYLAKASVLNPFAALYRDWGRFDDAEQNARQALELRKANLDSKHPDIAESLVTLGTVYCVKGRFTQDAEEKNKLLREAEERFLEVLDLRKELPQKNHPDLGESWNNLGVIYEQLGQLDKAEQFHKQAINFNEDVHGKIHPISAASNNNLGKVYLRQQKYTKALESFDKAEGVFAELDLPQSGWCRHNMALVYEAQEELDQAQENIVQAYQILKEKYKLPDNHPLLEECHKTYARITQGA